MKVKIMNNKSKVAIAIRNINTKSGLGKIILEQIKYLNSIGIIPDIYAIKSDVNIRKLDVNFIKMYNIPFISKYLKRLLFSSIFDFRIKNKNYDLIIGHGDIINPDVLFLHNLIEETFFLTNGKRMTSLNAVAKIHRLILEEQKFSKIIVNSIFMKNILINNFDIDKKKINVCYPGYNNKQFNANNLNSKKQIMKDKFKISQNTKVIGFITSGDFVKRNLSMFIKSLNLLDTEIDYKVLLIGKRKQLDVYLKEARNYNLEDKFIIHELIDNVEDYFHIVDFNVHPANCEEFGMVILEAMACGVPVITSKQVGMSEIIKDKNIVMNKPNIKELTFLIKNLLENDKLVEELSLNSIKCTKDRDWGTYIKETFEIMSKI
jgi:UDP-glucose:(heptosyl)LPS alpha-1,3-glucosyltransferase